jgi:uncharacterized protein YlxW (UPF0749 family)
LFKKKHEKHNVEEGNVGTEAAFKTQDQKQNAKPNKKKLNRKIKINNEKRKLQKEVQEKAHNTGKIPGKYFYKASERKISIKYKVKEA